MPDRHVEGIAFEIMRILEEHGIDSEDVYYSGHDGTDPDPDATKLEALNEISEGIEEDLIEGSGEDDPTGQALAEAARAQDAREEALFKRLGQTATPIYYMSRFEHLADPPDTYMNPIHCAGATATSQIVVYDRMMVDLMDLDGPSLSVIATQAQLEPAVRLRIHPNFFGVGGPLPEFAS